MQPFPSARRAGLGLMLAALLAAAPVAAGVPLAFGPDLAAQGWDTLSFRGRDPVSFAAKGAGVLSIRSEGGVSVLWRLLPRSYADATAASWRWRVWRGVPPTDLAGRNADDRDIAVYFLFADDAATLDAPPGSLREAFRKGRALIYVWGGDKPAGSVIASPHLRDRGKLIISQPAGAGPWTRASVDLRADFRRAFGREPGPLVGVAVSSDSDDTGSTTDAELADLVIR